MSPFGYGEPKLLDTPISAEVLGKRCAWYDKKEPSYNRSLAEYRTALRISVFDEESQRHLDLSAHGQSTLLIELLLNPWGCRLPKLESQHRATALDQVEAWWCGLDADVLPTVSDRLAADGTCLAQYAPVFRDLSERSVRVGGDSHTWGPVAASKTLYVLRPHFFLAWDTNIRKALGRPHGTAEDYVHFLEQARVRLNELAPDDESLKALQKEISQPSCTAAEMLNKYCWSMTRKKKGGSWIDPDLDGASG